MDISSMSDTECFELGRQIGERMSFHKQKELFEGIEAGYDSRRLAQQTGGDVILGPGRLLRPIIEMFARMDLYRIKRTSAERQVQA